MGQDEGDGLEFEQAFQRLEETVQALDRGGLTLDQAVALYEEGMQLAQVCSQRLDGAELKITELKNAFVSQSARTSRGEHDDAAAAP